MSAGASTEVGSPAHEGAGSLEALVEGKLQEISEDNARLNAVMTLAPDLARSDVARVLAAREAGSPLPLDGMTVVVKDNIDVGGVRGTRGSMWFADRVAISDATVVRRLRSQGAIVLATAGLHELAFGATSVNPHFGPVHNPWSVERIAGGSSGGSAAAVAAGWVEGALGTDTGGSVRGPAALCGVTGLRPTFGVISNHGVFPVAPSFDTVGPMARRATDVARLFAALCGEDRLDPDSVSYLGSPQTAPALCGRGVPRIGVPVGYFFEGVSAGVEEAVRAAIGTFEGIGASVKEIDIPVGSQAYEVGVMLAGAEALSVHHDRLESDPDRFGEDIARRLRLAVGLQGWEVAGLYRQLRSVRREALEVFADVDVIATPTVAHPAPPIASVETLSTSASLNRLTFPWGALGLPALSVPCGFDAERLPVGLQLVGPPHSDLVLCALGAEYQAHTDWHLRLPPLGAS